MNQPKRNNAPKRRRNNRSSRKSGFVKSKPRRQRAGAVAKMSPAGQAFLKCAYAPPDFNTDPGRGIPDKYNGKSLGTKHQLTNAISFAAGFDTYIVVAPTPGVAYWTFSVASGTALTSANTILAPQIYQDFNGLFGDPATGGNVRTQNVEAFRYASTAVGLYPTSNYMQFAGSVSVWKIPLKQSLETRTIALAVTGGATTQIDSIVLNGLEGLQSVSRENYTESFIKGLYTIATCNQAEFEFHDILEGVTVVPQRVADYAAQVAVSNMFGSLSTLATPVYLGYGDMDAIVIKVSTPSGTGVANSAVIKTWACVEYRPTPNSALYQYAGDSPPYDPIALEAYRRVAASLPTAVECAKNAEFWSRVKSLLRGVGKAVSYAPGALGMAGTGMGMLMDGLDALFLD